MRWTTFTRAFNDAGYPTENARGLWAAITEDGWPIITVWAERARREGDQFVLVDDRGADHPSREARGWARKAKALQWAVDERDGECRVVYVYGEPGGIDRPGKPEGATYKGVWRVTYYDPASGAHRIESVDLQGKCL